jgi:hypothetical protein
MKDRVEIYCRVSWHQGLLSLYRYGALTEVAPSSLQFINLFRLLLSLSWPPLLWAKSSTWEGQYYLLSLSLSLSVISKYNH